MIRRSLRAAAGALRLGRPSPVVLTYHRVAEAPYDPWGLAVSPRHFDAQLAMLKRDREVLPLAEFGRRLAHGRLGPRAVAITFDDGYACNAVTAAPILRRHGLPATFFLATGTIGGEREFWWDELARLVVETRRAARVAVTVRQRSVEIDFATAPVPPRVLRAWSWPTQPQHARLRLYDAIWAEMRALPHAEQVAALDAIGRACGIAPRARDAWRAMSWDEAHALACDPLFAIAPHSVTHPALGALPESRQRQEMVESWEACRAWSDNAAPLFAYPYGDFTETTVRIAREVGFELACSTRAQAVAADCDRHAIPRLQALDGPAARTARAMTRI